ncbi:hypothetical protein BS78_07G131200 [Paspalum vaginatum]|nr:hypothetical protein BS78_07G131200 [Paspalum vaginatum]
MQTRLPRQLHHIRFFLHTLGIQRSLFVSLFLLLTQMQKRPPRYRWRNGQRRGCRWGVAPSEGRARLSAMPAVPARGRAGRGTRGSSYLSWPPYHATSGGAAAASAVADGEQRPTGARGGQHLLVVAAYPASSSPTPCSSWERRPARDASKRHRLPAGDAQEGTRGPLVFIAHPDLAASSPVARRTTSSTR